jgi:8-oxo-dGTP diphosphatase
MGSTRAKDGKDGKDAGHPQAEGEAKFLRDYQPGDYPRPSVTVDLVILTVVDKLVRVLLVKRSEHPFKGRWALPGGFVRIGPSRDAQGEDLEAAARRELEEETGLSHENAGRIHLAQVGAFGAPNRDPRMRVISVAYAALVRPELVPLVRAGGDVSHVRWFALEELAPEATALAFDHGEIVGRALAHVRADLDRTPVAFELVHDTFTIQELRGVHEALRGEPLDPGNFRKKFLRLIEDGVIEVARGKRPTASKPASVYRFVTRTS